MTMARYHASASSTLALGFAFVYSCLYLPSEFNSLNKNLIMYLNATSSSESDASTLNRSVEAGSARISVLFFTWRVTSRIFLVALMAFLIGMLTVGRICIPDGIYHSHLLQSLLKGLRELLRNKQLDPSKNATPVEVLEVLELLTNSNMSVFFDGPLLSAPTNKPVGAVFSTQELQETAAHQLPSTIGHRKETDSNAPAKNKTRSALLPCIVCISSPVTFICVVIPSYVLRIALPWHQPPPRSLVAIQHACCLLILYNERVRRSAHVPEIFRP